ncbi:MAG: Gfo/Idh/MocA family oxidoreductase [Thermodesulfobacteriota bacterium]
MDKVRLGIVGSKVAASLHLSNLSKLRGLKVDVVEVASQKKENAESFAKKFNIPHSYDDYRRILERPDIDIVDLCVPTDLHGKFSIDAAEAGEDGSNATVFASDTVLGGVRNLLSVFLSNSVVYVKINPHDVLEVYAPEPPIFGEEYIAERLETKAGWNFPSPDDDWMKGFPQELEDFIDAVLLDREPVSGIDLARDVVEVIYAAYASAEKGMRIELRKGE